uniref:SMP-30/Gluconolactonase/LRE-like region domain-containing protein n=1 Tax=Branchiostoma floridae TaxID=7739 RepID=C3YWI1_BRAFL|eukprot:XP_002599213.1 hypothetical protein BRAFLDRAFT_64435 [Branchiostoma floridae]
MTSANRNTGAAELVLSQAEDYGRPLTQTDAFRHKKDEDDDIDHEDILTESGAAARREPTVEVKYGDTYILPYEISHMCQDHMAHGTTDTEETETRTYYEEENTYLTSNNDISDTPIGCFTSDIDAGSVENDENTDKIRHHTNKLYPHTMCLKTERVQNHVYTQNALNPTSINTENPNPMYAQNALNGTPVYQPNVRNPNPMYAPNENPELELIASESGISATSTETAISPGTVTSSESATLSETDTSLGTIARMNEDPTADATVLLATDGMAQASPETKPGKTTSRQADIDDIIPYAVRYQTDADDDDDMATKSNETRNRRTQDASSCNIDKIEPYAVRYGEDDDLPTDRNTTESEQPQDASPDNVNIEPYAVRYGEGDDLSTDRNKTEDKQTQDVSPDNDNTEPYAVAYMGQDQAPMPNGPQQHICGCRYRWESAVIQTAIALMALIIGGSLIWAFFINIGTQDTRMVTTANGSFGETAPTLSSSAGTSRAHYDGNEKSEMIIFGGLGEEPGKFHQNLGVAVSGDNEIFVADLFNQRIQVYTMGGVYLRLFPTVVPGKKVKKMEPSGVAIDDEGHLWVVGKRKNKVHVVKYGRDGQPLFKFDVISRSMHPDIAVDASNHKIIVTDMREILAFQPNGSLHLRFGEKRMMSISSATTDSEGNIFVTVISNSIQVYNRHGVRLFTARACAQGQRPCFPRGICLDTFGRIVVANGLAGRVDMYTSQGNVIRTLANITHPWGVAMGRDGQLVVTDNQDGTVTIFPRQGN